MLDKFISSSSTIVTIELPLYDYLQMSWVSWFILFEVWMLVLSYILNISQMFLQRTKRIINIKYET